MIIYATSDTHGMFDQIELPACHLLLHAGDICLDGYKKRWCREWPGLAAEYFRDKVYPDMLTAVHDKGYISNFVWTWGNHDYITAQESASFAGECMFPLIDNLVVIDGISVWGAPWSNQFMDWAWMKEPEQLKAHYDAIPEGVDIILSHQPPMGYGSTYLDFQTGKIEQIGSLELLDAINRVKPKAVVCGHIHSGFGTFQHGNTKIYNVSAVNEQYRVVNQPVRIEI